MEIKMKIECLKTIRNILCMLAWGYICCSCLNSGEVCPALPVDLDLQVGMTYASYQNGNTAENRLERLRVMVFHRSGGLDAQIYNPAVGGITPVDMNLTIESGNKVFVVIGNEPLSLTPTLNNDIKKLHELDALIWSDETTYNQPGAFLPFTKKHLETVSPGQTSPVRIGIQRAVGKVQMNISKEPSAHATIKIVSVQVIRTPDESRLLEGNPIDPATPGLITALAKQTFPDDGTNIVQSTSGDEIEMTPCYLYEHYRGKGTAAAGLATALELVLNINGTDKTYYVPLIGGYQGTEPVYAVVRNTIANLSVIVEGERLRVDYTLMDWNEEDLGNIDPSDETQNVTFTDWIEEGDYDYELPTGQ